MSAQHKPSQSRSPIGMLQHAALVLVLAVASPLSAVGAEPATEVVDLFQAIDAGDVAAQFIPANAMRANVLIRNTTTRELHVKLPDAIAAVPILAQFGQQGFGQQAQGPGGGGGGGGSNQAVGGGMDAGGRQGQNFGQGAGGQQPGGFMRIGPQKTRKVKATTVCLEHGKPDPHPRIAYKMIPIGQYTDDPRVAELCAKLGQRELDQTVAQAAAWHFANGLDWNALASINSLESKYLGNVPFFTSAELEKAKSLVKMLNEERRDDRHYALRD
ncbi:MAG: hypothetical protein HKN47_12615 [Pirellulaceae bacterium]|nr:hypothetical protein [Pirellulaceae bacterium]